MPYREFLDAHDRAYRAETHRRALRDEWNGLLEDDPYGTAVRVDDEGNGTLEVWCEYEPLPPLFALKLGELLYQLRAALDATIYGAAIRDSGQDPPPDEEKLEFPICRSPGQFEDSARKIAPLHEGRREIVRLVQPYLADELPDRIGGMNVALGILNDWARKDRHRKLHVVGSWASEATPQFIIPDGARIEDLHVRADGFLEHDHEVAKFRVVGWEPGMDIKANPDLMIDIALDEAPGPRNQDDTFGARIAVMVEAVNYVIGAIEHSYGPGGVGLSPQVAE